MLNKKGIGDAALWIIRILMLVGILAVIGLIKSSALSDALQTYDTEFYISYTKALYSPTGLAYQSLESGRAYPGIIDMGDFNEAAINGSMIQETPSRMTLMNMDGTLIRQIYYDRERFEILEPLTFAKQHDILNKTNYVLLREDLELRPALLNLEMVVSR